MEQEKWNNYISKDGIIEIQNRERSGVKLLSVEFQNNTTILNFENLLPVRELNFAEIPNWKIELYRISFGKNFNFITDNLIEEISESEIRFVEKERNLTVSINFNEDIVKETMLKYLDELIPRK